MCEEHRTGAGALADDVLDRSDDNQRNDFRHTPSERRQSSAPSKREKDDTYQGVIVNLNDKTRVVEGHDHACWIIQTKFGSQWTGVSFHRDREAMISRLQPLAPDVLAILQSLEEWHP
jgi:hypothetical protein